MNHALLTRRPHREAIQQSFVGSLELPPARVHEFCGPSRRSAALLLAQQMQGDILWVSPEWHHSRLHAQGILPFINPSRITFIHPKRADDLLWVMEETLRAGCIPLVVAELPTPPTLTPVRRLHLAAETGAQLGKLKPMGVILTPEDGGAAGVETRWHMAPNHTQDCTRWLLQRRRARMTPPAAWQVTWEKGRARIHETA